MQTTDRREFLQWAGALGLALSGFSCGRRKRPPNVLFVAIDDLNDWVGCLGGHPDARTPNIDRLADSGVLFTRAYAPATNCHGSRTAVLTGLRPWTTGVIANQSPAIGPEVLTLPVYFRQQGYRALGGGKVFHAFIEEPWDEYFVPEGPSLAEMYAARSPRGGYGLPNDSLTNFGPIRMKDERTWDGRLAGWAVEQLRREHRQPFFLGVGFFEPHMPWFVPRKYFRQFRPNRITLPPINWRDLNDVGRWARRRTFGADFRDIVRNGQWRHAVSAALAATLFIDAMLGKVLDALDESPYRDDTLVVLWSDHGFHHGEKTTWHKYVLWEQTCRVPFVVRAPGLTTPGSRCAQPVDLMHVFPTLVDLCSLPPAPIQFAGRSLRPLLVSPDSEWELPALTTGDWGAHGVRTKRWRYIRYPDGEEELYDHDNDPLEWTNLAGLPEYDGVKRQHAGYLPEEGIPG